MKRLIAILVLSLLAAPAGFADEAVSQTKLSKTGIVSPAVSSQAKAAKVQKEAVTRWSEDEKVLFTPTV